MNYSKEAEMMTLGAMIIDKENLKYGMETLKECDFVMKEHQSIFKAMETLHEKGKPVETVTLLETLKSKKTLDKCGGAGYLVGLAQYCGTSANIKEYIAILKDKTVLRSIGDVAQKAQLKVSEENIDGLVLLEEISKEIEKQKKIASISIQDTHVSDRIKDKNDMLKKHRGNDRLGLSLKSLEMFNRNLLGLRGLMLLAAAPNVGKTALTVQMGLEALLENKDACLIYVSLEMSSQEIFMRMSLNLSEMTYRQYLFGTLEQATIDGAFFTREEIERMKEADAILEGFGDRLKIIDQTECPFIDSNMIINYIEEVKRRSGTSKAIVVIDYLQVFPADPSLKIFNENELDKWRIGEVKKIRNSLNYIEEPVIVISEARKPTSKEKWGGDMSDVMGSARGSYTPDVVTLLSKASADEVCYMLKSRGLVGRHKDVPPLVIEDLADNGISLCGLTVSKARDGMKKFSTMLEFHFMENKFKPVNWTNILGILEK